MSHWYLGTIGFSYKDWVGEFYPIGTSPREYLPYYCKVFNSVEIDTTFHSVPRPAMVATWVANSPQDFKFCLKTPRTITHELGLKDTQGLMDEFLDAVQALQDKTGPILIQLPPSFSIEHYLILSDFLDYLPPKHLYAVEFRHPSWYNERTQQLLSDHRVCWATIDYPRLPKQVYLTTDFLYLRWIGVNNLYHRHSFERVDTTNQLKAWTKVIEPYLEQVSVIYGFFNNDYAGFAAGTCKRYMRLLGLTENEPDTPFQQRLF